MVVGKSSGVQYHPRVGSANQIQTTVKRMRQMAVFPVALRAMCVMAIAVIASCAPEPPAIHDTPAPTVTTTIDSDSALTRVATHLPADNTPLPNEVPDAAVQGCNTDGQDRGLHYAIDATLDWMAHTLRAVQRVTYRNNTGTALRDIRFNVEPNRDDGHFDLARVALRGTRTTSYTLDGAQLTVRLTDALEPGCTIDIELQFNVIIPAILDGYRFGHLGYWGYSDRQINLGLWFPMIAAYDARRGWISPPFHDVGEYHVLRAADYSLDFAVKNAPQNVTVACPGDVTQENDHSWHIEVHDARELTISVSDAFKIMTTTTESDVEVTLYYLTTPAIDTLDGPRHALTVAADALALYEMLYGPYPFERLVVVEGDFPDGMEFSGLVFVSEAWFRTWRGVVNDWLAVITAHEIAHQWWYSQVGNDQGLHPYLDEALAVYSELLFFEHYYPELTEWWWQFRINSYAIDGFLDAPVYDFQSARPYINAVYLQGALMLDRLRDQMGNEAFFAWLDRYLDAMRGQIASPLDFWGAMHAEEYIRSQSIRATFLRNRNVLPSSDSIP